MARNMEGTLCAHLILSNGLLLPRGIRYPSTGPRRPLHSHLLCEPCLPAQGLWGGSSEL